MEVLVTGAAGFLGQAVVETLATEHTLRLLDLCEMDTPHDMVVGSVADRELVLAATEGCDAIVNAAVAPDAVYGEAPDVALNANVVGTHNLLEAARQHELQHVVHLSTVAVHHGVDARDWVTAELPLDATTPYGLTKILAEEVCCHFARTHGMSITMFRPWIIIDERQGINKYGETVEPSTVTVDRYEIARAIALALAKPGDGLKTYLLPGNAEARERIEWEPVERDVGWRAQKD